MEPDTEREIVVKAARRYLRRTKFNDYRIIAIVIIAIMWGIYIFFTSPHHPIRVSYISVASSTSSEEFQAALEKQLKKKDIHSVIIHPATDQQLVTLSALYHKQIFIATHATDSMQVK